MMNSSKSASPTSLPPPTMLFVVVVVAVAISSFLVICFHVVALCRKLNYVPMGFNISIWCLIWICLPLNKH